MRTAFKTAAALGLILLATPADRGDVAADPIAFVAVNPSPTSTPDAWQIAVADFDRDGFLDMVVANADSTGFGRGDGTFDPETKIHTGAAPLAVTAADFNEDGNPDFATANADTSGGLSVVLGHGDGTFEPERRLHAGVSATGIVAADLDGDGHADLVVVNSTSADVSCCAAVGMPPTAAAAPDPARERRRAAESAVVGAWRPRCLTRRAPEA